MSNQVIQSDRIAVFGVGGSGCRIVNRMASQREEIDFFAIDTDVETLASLQVKTLQIKCNMVPNKPFSGRINVVHDATVQYQKRLTDIVSPYDIIYLVSGMGGATGTGASKVIAQLVKDHGKDCIAVLSKPFLFEGKLRIRNAEIGIQELISVVDMCHLVECQSLFSLPSPANVTLKASFQIIDKIMQLVLSGCFSFQQQEPFHWKKIQENNGGSHIEIGIANQDTNIPKALQHALNIHNNARVDPQIMQAYLHLTGPVDLHDQCMDMANKTLRTSTDIAYHFDKQESPEEEYLFVVAFIVKNEPKEYPPPVKLIEQPLKIGAGGSRNHGLGGSFSTDILRPRLWLSASDKKKERSKPTDESLSDKS